MNPDKPKISWRKLVTAVVVVCGAGFAGWFFQPSYHGNDEALASLVSIFSILAGFLAAIIAVVANDRALKGRTWRQDTFYLDKVKKELKKHQLLFYMYLITLTLAFICQLKLAWGWDLQIWLERILLFFATLAMSMSFALPVRLTKRQVEDLEKVIKEREQRETGNKSSPH